MFPSIREGVRTVRTAIPKWSLIQHLGLSLLLLRGAPFPVSVLIIGVADKARVVRTDLGTKKMKSEQNSGDKSYVDVVEY